MRIVTYRTGCSTYMSREGAGCLESAKRRAVEIVRLRDRKIEKRRIKITIEKKIKMKKKRMLIERKEEKDDKEKNKVKKRKRKRK